MSKVTIIFIRDESANYFLDSISHLVQKMSMVIAHHSLLEVQADVSKLFVVSNQLSETQRYPVHYGDPNKQWEAEAK